MVVFNLPYSPNGAQRVSSMHGHQQIFELPFRVRFVSQVWSEPRFYSCSLPMFMPWWQLPLLQDTLDAAQNDAELQTLGVGLFLTSQQQWLNRARYKSIIHLLILNSCRKYLAVRTCASKAVVWASEIVQLEPVKCNLLDRLLVLIAPYVMYTLSQFWFYVCRLVLVLVDFNKGVLFQHWVMETNLRMTLFKAPSEWCVISFQAGICIWRIWIWSTWWRIR